MMVVVLSQYQHYSNDGGGGDHHESGQPSVRGVGLMMVRLSNYMLWPWLLP
jgi:hypothetical protein